jgi:hypothetical protein
MAATHERLRRPTKKRNSHSDTNIATIEAKNKSGDADFVSSRKEFGPAVRWSRRESFAKEADWLRLNSPTENLPSPS